jgi:MATE family multidrug resistance protein
MTVIFSSKQDFPMIFTKSEDMIHAASELAYLLGITMIINSVAQTISGD